MLRLGILGCSTKALSRRTPAVSVERVYPRKEISTIVTEVELERVPFCGFTVAFECIPCLQSSLGTELALDLLDRPTGPVSLRGHEERPAPCLKLMRNLEKFVLLFLLPLLHHFLLYTPLDPNQPSIWIFFCPPLRESWSWQGSMVNSLRIRCREPLHYASRFLGFMIDVCFWDPGCSLAAGPWGGLRCQNPSCLVGPDSFFGRHFMTVEFCWAA